MAGKMPGLASVLAKNCCF